MKKRMIQLCLILILIGLAGATGYKAWQNQKKTGEEKQRGVPGVVAYTAARLTFVDRIEAVGTAEANEAATLTATAAETVTAINFEEGSFVTSGTILIQLNDAEERAEMEDARKAFERYSALARTSAASMAQKDTAKAALQIAEARVRDRQIVAPFDGLTGFRHVSLGDLISPGAVVTSLYDIDPIKLEFTVPETYLSGLAPGLEIEAYTDAWPDQVFEGKITVIDPRINPVTRAVSLKAEIENPEGKLKPGLLMTVDIVRNERTAIGVPEAAILQQGDSQNVYLIDKEMKALLTPINIGSREAGYVEVLEGLEEGDKIVAEGLLKVRAGSPVKIERNVTIESMIEAAAGMAAPRKRESLK